MKLMLAQVHAALAYYYGHNDGIDAEFADERAFDEGLRARDEYLKKHSSGR